MSLSLRAASCFRRPRAAGRRAQRLFAPIPCRLTDVCFLRNAHLHENHRQPGRRDHASGEATSRRVGTDRLRNDRIGSAGNARAREPSPTRLPASVGDRAGWDATRSRPRRSGRPVRPHGRATVIAVDTNILHTPTVRACRNTNERWIGFTTWLRAMSLGRSPSSASENSYGSSPTRGFWIRLPRWRKPHRRWTDCSKARPSGS